MPTASEPEPTRCIVCGSALSEKVAQGLCVNCLAKRFIEPAAPGDTSPLPDITFPDGYEGLEVLGRGGMGTVYLVYQRNLARYVAMKQLAANLRDNVRACDRFRHEAKASARLNHPGIVPILDFDIHEGQAWYTMEYVEGGDLAEAMKMRGGKLPWPEAVDSIAKVSEAIAYAHKEGVVHRDLKPSNILLDYAGQPKVCDFGLAWITGQEGSGLTGTGEVLGTPAYLAPDALAGGAREFDARASDIYSLGAVLFHLISGRPPFIGEHTMQVLSAIAKDPAPRLADILGDETVPAELDALCSKCLEKKPEDRFKTADELAQALRACLAPGEKPPAKTTHALVARQRFWTLIVGSLAAVASIYFIASYANHYRQVTVVQAASTPTILAVMPAEAATSDDTTSLLASGLHDELVSELAGLSSLRIVSDRSVRAAKKDFGDPKAMREVLGADAVLYIRVQKWQDLLRFTTQLVDTKDGSLRWSKVYDRHETNLLNLQTDIATQLAAHLNVQMKQGENAHYRVAVGSPAQKLFLKAKGLVHDASTPLAQFNEAEQLLQDAIKAEPNFAEAYAELSGLYTQMFNWGLDRTQRRLRLGLDMAQKAVQLNPDSPAGEVALGNYFVRGSKDYISARPHFEHALQLAPNTSEALNSLAFIERRQGDFPAASKHYASALELDPLNPILAYNTVDTYIRLREYDTASAKLEQALLRMPGHIALVKLKGNLYVSWKGDLGPMKDDLTHRDPTQPTADLFLMDKIEWLTLAHRPEDALAALSQSGLKVLEGQTVYFTRAGYEALIDQQLGKNSEAQDAAKRALEKIKPVLQARPYDARVLLHAGEMEAILGHIPEAESLVTRTITPGDVACADAFDRGYYQRSIAIMYANAGKDDEARAMLKKALSEPNQLSVQYIRLHPSLSRFGREFK